MIKQNNQGFTLIEIIISIAVLSIISAIFLELFIKSDFVQTQSQTIDDISFISSNLLEELFSEDSLTDFSLKTQPQKEMVEGDNWQLQYYFDENLKPATESNYSYLIELEAIKKEELKYGGLYAVAVKGSTPKSSSPFVIETHYYEKEGGAHEKNTK